MSWNRADLLGALTKPCSSFEERLARNNYIVCFVVMATSGVLGSLASVIISVSAVFLFGNLILGQFVLVRDSSAKRMNLSFLIYFGIVGFISLYHFQNGANFYVIFEAIPFLYFILLISAFAYSDKEILKKFFSLGAVCGACLAFLFGLFESMTAEYRWDGIGGNQGPYSVSMCIIYGICVLSFFESKCKMKYLFAFAALLAFACVLMSGIRSSYPLLLLLPFIGLAFYSRKYLKYFMIFGGLIFLISLSLALFNSTLLFRVFEIANNIQSIQAQSYSNSLGIRLIMWDHGVLEIFKNPILGFGETSALSNLDDHFETIFGASRGFTHFHNLFVFTLVRGGLLEFAALIILFFGPLLVLSQYSKKQENWFGLLLWVFCINIYLIAGIFNTTLSNDIMDHLFVFIASVAFILSRGSVGKMAKKE